MLKYLAILMTVIFASVAVAPNAYAAKDEIYTARSNNLAVEGYDTVSYFTDGDPVKGSAEITHDYKGATWQFSSVENRDKFIADPEAYAPQYGGYCAWAMAKGKFAKGQAKVWNVVDGKLYLNYSRGVEKKWLKDVPGFIEKADAIWPAILEK